MVWYAQEVLHLSKKVLSHTTIRKMRERGNDLGFTHVAQIYPMGIAYT